MIRKHFNAPMQLVAKLSELSRPRVPRVLRNVLRGVKLFISGFGIIPEIITSHILVRTPYLTLRVALQCSNGPWCSMKLVLRLCSPALSGKWQPRSTDELDSWKDLPLRSFQKAPSWLLLFPPRASQAGGRKAPGKPPRAVASPLPVSSCLLPLIPHQLLLPQALKTTGTS